MPKATRLPPPADLDLIGERRTIQVNHCRRPDCDNFAVPARHEKQQTGPSRDRDPAYKVDRAGRGQLPSLRCKSCGEKPPLKSNASIAAEVERLIEADGLRTPLEAVSCPNPDCDNHTLPVAGNVSEGHRRTPAAAYRRAGRSNDGAAPRFQCKRCGRKFSASDPVRLHDRNRRLAADVFGRVANKSPIRGVFRGAGLNSVRSYYPIMEFVRKRCRAHSGAVDRALIDGRLRLPEAIVTQTDAQEFTINWTSRLDRRNVVVSSYATVDAASRFILGMHLSFDERVDPFEINRRAALAGDLGKAEALREHAQYWLAGDELEAGRAQGRKLAKHARVALLDQISLIYAGAESRADVENAEIDHHDPNCRQMPPQKAGMQCHMPYTAYAHWMLLRRLLNGAGAVRVQANMDQCSMSRAGFLCAFADAIRRGDAHGFYVRYTKYQSVDQRRGILGAASAARARFREGMPPDERDDPQAVSRAMMRARLAAPQEKGQWRDEWVEHPQPTMNEPHKAMSWLTGSDAVGGDDMVDMFLNAGLAAIDNVFMKARRLFSALERAVGVSNDTNTVWHGYAPYNPAMLRTYLTLFRTVHNFVSVGEDGRTPAMRLGFAREPLAYEDILWPGQPVPRPKQARRRGRKLDLPTQMAS